MIIHLLAEGRTEVVVAAKLLPFCGHDFGDIYGEKGYQYIRDKAAVFHHLATEHSGVLILTDFRDAGIECIPTAVHEYILRKVPHPPKTFLCRFAVSEIESWLMADRKGIADYMGISVSRVPLQPENERYPKKILVDLARFSRKRRIREGMALPHGHRASVGPEYMSCISEFITDFWDIETAMDGAPSLMRCVCRLRALK